MVSISTNPGFSLAGNPQPVPTALWRTRGRVDREYDIMPPNATRFIVTLPAGESATAPQQINVVLNWTEELKPAVAPAVLGRAPPLDIGTTLGSYRTVSMG